MDSDHPQQDRGAPSIGPKPNNEAAAKNTSKTKTLNMAAKAGTDLQLMVQNWNRHTQDVIHLVMGNTFTHKELCFQADLSLCAQVLQTDD